MSGYELEAYLQNKKLDIIASDGTKTHYDMNDYGWLTHAQGYRDFGEEILKHQSIDELNSLVNSDNLMDYYKIEHLLIVKGNYFSHKSWIDEDKEYHHFCYSTSGLSNEQSTIYEDMKIQYDCNLDNLWDKEEINSLQGDIFECDLIKEKNQSHL